MNSRFLKICSVFMAIVLLANMLPLNVWAEQIDTQTLVNDTPVQAEVLGEVIEKRTEYTKEFLLDNGSFVAAVYNEPVHFEEDGQWKEIDNTLVSKADGTYTNTDGVWDVRFPQMLSQGNHISITKDGYTLSFGMAGELRNQGNLEVASADASLTVSPTPLETASIEVDGTAQTFAVSNMQIATAQIQELDVEELKASVKHEELILEKNTSQLMYNNVYSTTDIRYDLQSNKVKESVILESYDSGLRGYRYTLNVGELEPMLFSDGSVRFYDEAEEKVVMFMPAPFLLDNNGEMSTDVQVSLTGNGSTYTLVYLLPQAWLASSDRAWPVVLDPVVQADPDALKNVRDRTIASKSGAYAVDSTYLVCGYAKNSGINQVYLMFNYLPELTSSDVILSANLSMIRYSGVGSGAIPIEAHKVKSTWDIATLSWFANPGFYEEIEDYQMVSGNGTYTWNITDIVRDWYESANTGLMFKTTDDIQNAASVNYRQFYSANTGYPESMPTLTVYYRNNNGLESYWDYTSASAGRAGTGHVNSYTGNMVWTRSDIGFDGNRAPVTINHVYNLNDSASNDFGMGYGWRISYNQRVEAVTLGAKSYYRWEDSDGTSHYFEYDSEKGVYVDEADQERTLIINVVDEGDNPDVTSDNVTYDYGISDKYENFHYFDDSGRLVRIRNNQETKSSIAITYIGNSLLIDKITDGAGRVYDFTYEDNLLQTIEYKGNVLSSDPLENYPNTTFGYDTVGNLRTITDNDDKTCTYTYLDDTHILSAAADIDGYKLQYSYYVPADTYQPYRVSQVESFDGSTAGGSISFAYAHNQTTFTDHNGNVEIMQFNDYGNTVSIQDGQGRAQYAKYAVNSSGETGKSNQLTLSSKLQNTVVNLLNDSSFENGSTWGNSLSVVTNSISTAESYMGSQSLAITKTTNTGTTGIYSNFFDIASGETYVFSAYVKTTNAPAWIAIGEGGTILVNSNKLPANSDWTRLEVTYTNNTAETKTISARLRLASASTVYMDCVQLETMPTASRYNLVQNGDFRTTGSWSSSAGQVVGTSAAPQMNTTVYEMTGSMTAENRITQTVPVSGSTGDTFVLAGWGKGDSVPLPKAGEGENQRYFAIIGEFHYTEDVPTTEENEDGETVDIELRAIAQFNPDSNAWQYVAQPMVAKGAFDSITITLAYDYNANTACFDGIQLFKETYGSSYTYDNEGNITSITDAEKQQTKYTYDDETQDLTKEELPTGMTYEYTYDDWHNVKTSTSSDGQVITYNYDPYGNLLSQTTTCSGITTTTSSTYSTDGNRVASTTDAAGNVTTYSYDEHTNLLEWVQLPGDTASTATYYAYDAMNRTTRVSAVATENPAVTTGKPLLEANYTYNDKDQLSQIRTASTAYNFSYTDFSLRSAIKVGTNTLATYSYTNDQNKYLQSLTYGNGCSVQYDYDAYGRMTRQTYNDGAYVTYQYDNDGALATVYDSETGVTTKYYYDFTGRAGATELRKNADLVFRISAEYDQYNRLTRNGWQFTNAEFYNFYTYNANGTLHTLEIGQTASGTDSSLSTITYAYDGLYRATGMNAGEESPANRQYTYRTANGQATTQIEKLSYSDVTLPAGASAFDFQYTYDSRGNISSYTSPDESVTYTYDSQNQLLSATDENGTDYAYTYDSAGNITSVTKGSTTYTYSYENANWGDLLTKYNGTTISYDAIGNPTAYYNGWNFTWKHGRQMATASNGTQSLSFTYDADGLRTTKNVDGVVHTYYYSGGKLMREAYDTTVLDFFYDQSGTPFMLRVNNTPYYYVTNAQGDVIRLTDADGDIVASYQYDPYGAIVSATGELAQTNPLRYRAYYFDKESGLYYLQSRYYNPEIGRFINADAFISTGQGILDNNMFVYCGNNPAIYFDPTGTCKNTFSNYLKSDCGKPYCPTSESYIKGNYTIHGGNGSEQIYTNIKVYENISKEEANHFYDTIKKGHYGDFSGENLLSYFGEFLPEKLNLVFSAACSLANAVSNFGTSNIYDRENRLLYLEEGYNVIVLDRGYMVGDSNRTEKEYFIFDSDWVLQFNDVRASTIQNPN